MVIALGVFPVNCGVRWFSQPGNSWINAHNVFVHGVPYGGVNLSGLGGGVLGPKTFFDYLRDLSVVRPI
jgi:aldehyde dehydrogenase (NAD+)